MRGACSTHTVLLLPSSTIPYHSLVVVLLLCLSFVFGFPPKTSECCNQLLTYEVLVVSEQHLKMMMWKWNTNVYNELNFVSFPINCQFNLFFFHFSFFHAEKSESRSNFVLQTRLVWFFYSSPFMGSIRFHLVPCIYNILHTYRVVSINIIMKAGFRLVVPVIS